jgi:hypothetical protein
MGRWIPGLAVGLVLAAASVARAEVDKKWVKQVVQLLEQGEASGAARLLGDDGAVAQLPTDPPALAEIAFTAGRRASSLSRSKDDAVRIAGILEDMGTAAVAAKGEDAEAHRALGLARLAAGRIARQTGAADLTSEKWTQAADSFEKSYELAPKDGAALASASEALAEAAGLPGVDAGPLMERAVAVSKKSLEKHPDSVSVLRSASILDLSRARKAFEAKDKAGADDLLAAAAARLAPKMKGEDPDIDLATAFNEIVAFAKSNPKDLKKVKAGFVASTVRIGQFIDAQVPRSRYWDTSQAANGMIFQFSPYFEPLRTLSFGDYAWDTNWSLADGTRVGGDNIKGLASNEYEIRLRELKSVKTKKPPVKKTMNRGLDEGWYFEITGIQRDGDLAIERAWFFKSKAGHMTTLRLTLFEYKEELAADPLAQFILDSIREAPRR